MEQPVKVNVSSALSNAARGESKIEEVTNFSALVEVAERHNQLRMNMEGVQSDMSDLLSNLSQKKSWEESKEDPITSVTSAVTTSVTSKSNRKNNTKKVKTENCHSNSVEPAPSESTFTTSITSTITSSNSKSTIKYSSSSVTTTNGDVKDSSQKDRVLLERQVLLSMTSNAFEQYASDIATARTLTTYEEKQLKAQRRLISNRESAQASRKRKKAYVEELEAQLAEMSGKVSHLQANNATLNAQVADLESENISLRNQLAPSTTTSERLSILDGRRKFILMTQKS